LFPYLPRQAGDNERLRAAGQLACLAIRHLAMVSLVPDDLWQAIQPLLPTPPRRYGYRRRVDDRAALGGIVYQLRTGVPWRLPAGELGCGSPVTCWRRLRDWQRAGVWRLHQVLLDQLGRQGRLDWSRASLESMSVRAKRGAA
jgi:transposase